MQPLTELSGKIAGGRRENAKVGMEGEGVGNGRCPSKDMVEGSF